MHAHLVECTEEQERLLKAVKRATGLSEAEILEKIIEQFFTYAEELAANDK